MMSPFGPSSTIQVMWDRPDFPFTLLDPNGTLFDFRRDILRTITKGPPRRRFFRYLPLYCEKEYASGLTVYISTHGIIGLEAYFTRTSQLSGSRRGCALHFPLRAQERIVYTWLRIVNSISPAFIAPMLAVGLYWPLSQFLLILFIRFKRHMEESIHLDHIFYHPW